MTTKNSLMKFIDSCVGNIARKIEDEFRESDHPRDKGGKFTSKGNEGRGGGDVESSKKFSKRINTAVDKFESMFESDPQQAKEHLYALGVDADEADSFKEIEADVISAVTKNLNRAEAKLRIDGDEEDDDNVTGPEDRDYMLEEDDDDEGVSLDQYKENVRENFDGGEEYEVEARYDRAKYHSDQFKKLKQGEFYGTPKEKQLKNYYRRLGIKKPEDAFKVWWDI